MATNKNTKKANSVSTKPSDSRYAKTVTLTIPSIKKPKMPENKRARFALVALAFLLISIASGFLGGWIGSNGNQVVLGDTSLGSQKQIVTSDSQLISEIAKTVGPSVVSVNVAITTAASNTSNTGGFGLYGFFAARTGAGCWNGNYNII